MNAKPTPGPWLVSASGPTVYALHDQPPRNRFSALMQAGRRDDAQHAELMANAMLCAAAPDLLAALRLIEHATAPSHDDGGHHEAAHEIAVAAIAKAEGRS